MARVNEINLKKQDCSSSSKCVCKMVLPKINYGYITRNTIRNISSNIPPRFIVSHHQAFSILKHFILSSIRRLRIAKQLTFISECIQEEIYTNKIGVQVQALHLREHQRIKLQEVMMKNIRTDLYKELVKQNRTLNASKQEIRRIFDIYDRDSIF